jgi:hypothetical protein
VWALAGCGAPDRPPALDAEELAAPERRFVVGNEGRHDVFAAALAGRGGAALCVGGDHCYTIAALAGADRLFVVDHDARVIAVHRELGARVAAAATAEELLAGLAAAPVDAELAAAWPVVREHLGGRVAARAGTWLSDPVLYARSHALWRSGAVHAVVGDLAGARAMASVARAAREGGYEFTAVYLSNVEETIADRGRLRANLAELPRAAGSALLRTFYLEDWAAADGLWSYQVHALDHYLERAGDPPMGLAEILADAASRGELRVDAGQPGLSFVESRGPSSSGP